MRFLRWIIIGAAVVIVVGVIAIAAGAAWLNTYIQSEAFRHEVEVRAGQTLDGTVQIQKVDFNLFEGVKLEGFVSQIDPSHVNGQGALMVKVESVNCTYAWKELFNRTLKLTGVSLNKPQIVLTKQPVAPMAPAANPGGGETPGAGQSSGPVGPQGQGGTSTPFQFILEQAKLNDGTVSVLDETGASMVKLQGVNANANTSGYYTGADVTGSLRISDLILGQRVHATNFSTSFTYRTGSLELKPFQALAFNGRVAGGYQLGAEGSILDLNAKDFDVAQLTSALSPGSPGKLSGSLDMQSKWRGVESSAINGEGDAQLTGGKLKGVKILEQLSQILRVNELAAPVISKAQTHFLVADQQTQLTGLQIESTVFKMTGGGSVGFDGTLNLDLVLILTRDAMSKMPKEVATSFVQQQDGTGSIGFHVSGTTAHPETDLPTRLVLQNTQIKNVINKQLNKFFHRSNPNPTPAPDSNLAPPPDSNQNSATPADQSQQTNSAPLVPGM